MHFGFRKSLIVAVLLALWGVAPMARGQSEVILLRLTNSWQYNQTTSYDGTNWTAPGFDDSALPSGRGVLAYETNSTFVTSRTNAVLTIGRTTYYFRTRFTFSNNPAGVSLTFSNTVDDGAVFYLNGVELNRLFMPPAPATIDYATLASSHEATAFEVFTLSGPIVETNLVNGTNVLAVEVHQASTGSSDIAFGLALSAQLPDLNQPPTLRMPQEPPSYGYRLTNAFGNLAFTDPVAIVTPPGETNRIFVVEQAGRIGVITNLAGPTRTVFLDIASRIIAGGEEGLLGLAFHPGYVTNRQFYIFYTVNASSAQGANARHDRLSRMLASATNRNLADPSSELILIEQFDEAGNHNGGDLHFGNDGYLYVSLGDEGGGGDNYQNSQRIDRDFFAGLLRIDVDDRPSSVPANPHPANTNNATRTIRYRIPADNPWVGATTFNGTTVNSNNVRTEFYAAGLRNPWRFSVDRPTGDLFLADVGQNAWEEVNIIRRGGNYGWNYREGLHAGNRGNPPAGIVFDNPIAEYAHGNATNQGFSVTGGFIYRGDRLPALNGAYIFADYVSGHVWALRANGTNVVPFWRLLTDDGIAGFGVDPRNGDVLTADQSQDMLKRLVEDTSVTVGTQLPPTLFHTGAFTNLAALTSETNTLTPNAGVLPYDINVPFWSDNARKTRWHFRPSTNLTIGFSADGNWSFPTGTVWVKHFDLELTNGVPSSAKRLETRLLVKNAAGVYGVTYRWGSSISNATLVPDAGMDESLVINDGGVLRTQVWHYPGRSECLTCHTPVSGFALGFGTAQLNREVDFGSGPTNQLAALAETGFFNAPFIVLRSLNLLPALAHARNATWSREWRVRSYLHANCAQCHQPGGAGLGSWDARYHNPLSASGLIRGVLDDARGDTNNRVVVPGDLAHSMLHTRIATRGQGQMPPLATSVLDTEAIALMASWITNDLAGYQSFPEWQIARFGATNAPNAGANEDADADGAPNHQEWLTGTDPNSSQSFWSINANRSTSSIEILVPQIANRGFEVQRTLSLSPTTWRPLDVAANRPFFSATNRLLIVEDPTNAPTRFYRVRVFEP
jgi:glucose/arabinose dehydrogenase/mono/diheme cytochrome c family protein